MISIAIVAGEASGDLLGASLINAVKQRYPDAEFFGVAGPKMIEAGATSLFPMEQLSVMGLVEVLKHLPSLLAMRKQLFNTILERQPDIFIGIDAPDFNLALEKKLKHKGIKTVHYVSPSVWAWRQWRVKKIAKSVDLMLTLFPFEAAFYEQHNVEATFVGHPLADMIPMTTDAQQARDELGLGDGRFVALLPGSRMAELERLSDLFIESAIECASKHEDVHFLVPFANEKTRQYFQRRLDANGMQLPLTLYTGQSRTVMQASDIILLASGTAALEAMLFKKPMVVAYKLADFTMWFLKKFRILKSSLYSLPNILAGREIVSEYIQADATTHNLSSALLKLLDDEDNNTQLIALYNDIHTSLKQDASQRAADSILGLIGSDSGD